MAKCEQQGCREDAWLEIHWPNGEGVPVPCCVRHAGWAKRVAEAMGFDLKVTPIAQPPPDLIVVVGVPTTDPKELN